MTVFNKQYSCLLHVDKAMLMMIKSSECCGQLCRVSLRNPWFMGIGLHFSRRQTCPSEIYGRRTWGDWHYAEGISEPVKCQRET